MEGVSAIATRPSWSPGALASWGAGAWSSSCAAGTGSARPCGTFTRERGACIASEVDAPDRLSVLAADLTGDAGWKEAVEGCDYILHVASPFPPRSPRIPTS